MAASKFDTETCDDFISLIGEGFSQRDAARAIEVSEKTVKGWLSRGRSEAEGPYAEFASAVDAARAEAADREQPMDEEELFLAVSRAARKGSVQAQKLYWEMLRAPTDDDEIDTPADPFDALDAEDELAKRRQAS